MFIDEVVERGITVNFSVVKMFIGNVVMFRNYGWYINMYLGLMLIAPVINHVINYMIEKNYVKNIY